MVQETGYWLADFIQRVIEFIGSFKPFEIMVDEIYFKNNHPIHDVMPPEWTAGGDDRPVCKSVCYTKGSPLKMDVTLKIKPPLEETKRISLKVDGPDGIIGQKDFEITGEYCNVNGIETTRLPDKVKKLCGNLNWSFSVNGGSWQTANSTGPHDIYITYGAPKCDLPNFIEEHIDDAVIWALGMTTEEDITEVVCYHINGEVTSGCVCSIPDFNYHWRGARGEHSEGMCCCRAKGMILILQVLGVGTYIQDFVNEMPEPNSSRDVPNPAFCNTHRKTFYRRAWGGGIYNTWQGVCKKANGGICYSPQGPHISAYEMMNDASEYPDRQPFDRVHAFEHYAWVTWDGGDIERCIHLPKPRS